MSDDVTHCRKCGGICHITGDPFVPGHGYCCRDCLKLTHSCFKCSEPTFGRHKFQNKTLYFCYLHVPNLNVVFDNRYRCAQCRGWGCYADLYACEKCSDVICQTCVYGHGRRRFDVNGKVFCIKCEGKELLKEYEILWKFRKRFLEVKMGKWSPVLFRYVALFTNYKI